MDSFTNFTEQMLARARERQKMLSSYSCDENYVDSENTGVQKTDVVNRKMKSSKPESTCSQNIHDEATTFSHKMPDVNQVVPKLSETVVDDNIPNFARQNSKTFVSSKMPGSPQSCIKTLNIQKENFNMEIKVTSSDDVRVEVEIEEKDDSEGEEDNVQEVGLREDAKNRLMRLGRLYAGGEDANISSPIHRTEEKFLAECESRTVKQNVTNNRKGLRRLDDLAENMKQWENDTKPRSDICRGTKKSVKPPAPQPPISTKVAPTKYKAPDPPKVPSYTEQDSNSTRNKQVEVLNLTPKTLKWDKNVLDTLESQGFTRTESNSRLVYKYASQDQEKHDKVKSANTTKTTELVEGRRLNVLSEDHQENDVNSPAKQNCSPKRNIKSPVKENYPPKKNIFTKTPARTIIADKAAVFEGSPNKNSKDPSSLSVSERKALFEKNKGQAPIPKAPFATAIPINSTESKKSIKTNSPVKSTTQFNNAASQHNPPVPKAPSVIIKDSPTKAVIAQAGGIATTMAALLEKKNTISQEQIQNDVRQQRKKEMELLLNRFNKNKDLHEDIIEELDEGDDSGNVSETTAMLSPKREITINCDQSPQKVSKEKYGGNKRCSKSVSPKVAAVLEDVKRIRVSPPKVGKLYPNLSDIEAITETETDDNTRSPTPNNSSLGESSYESDDANTSFGREILQVVCKNQTPQKRNILDESTASDLSDILDNEDGYLDEALAYDECVKNLGPTPPKQGRPSPHNNQAQPSNSFHYKSFSPNVSEGKSFKTPMKLKSSPRKSSDMPNYVMDGGNAVPLTTTVSFYRRQQSNTPVTPIKQVSRCPLTQENVAENKHNIQDSIEEKISTLQDEVNKQQSTISQTSRALNLCYSTTEFTGSTEQVELEKVLLLSTHRRQAMLNEIQRLKVEGTFRPQSKHAKNLPLEKGSMTISGINLPLKRDYVRALAAAGGKGHHVVCLIKCGEQVVATKLVSTVAGNIKNPDIDLTIPGVVTLNDIYSDFAVTLEVYCLQAQEEILPHEVKYHINSKKTSNKTTPKKSKQDSRLIRPLRESPGGPQAVRSPTFALMGYLVFSIQAVNKTHWSLNNAPSMSPLEGSVQMQISCELAVTVEQRGFLTMFEDISGFGAWHRRWCLLKGHTLSYWKYPDDEKKMAPIESIDLKNCITKQVGPVSRDICARLHTILLETERLASPRDKDTLVMVCKGDKTVIRHLLSSDTKEERIEWCAKFNSALTALRMWGKS